MCAHRMMGITVTALVCMDTIMQLKVGAFPANGGKYDDIMGKNIGLKMGILTYTTLHDKCKCARYRVVLIKTTITGSKHMCFENWPCPF